MSKKRRKVRKPKKSPPEGIIKTEYPLSPPLVVFSFKYLDSTKHEFRLNHPNLEHDKLLERLKNISAWTWNEFFGEHGRSLRAHSVIWSDTDYKDGFNHLGPQLQDMDGYQFSISQQRGRVLGLILDNVFYVVWLDADHRAYSQ